jgi:hypothetical protein
MKTLTGIVLFFAAIFLSSCEGEQGPPGMDGIDGDSMIGTVFEIEGTFDEGNDYMLYFGFPDNFEILDGDIVLVYILWDQTDDALDIWRLLPQTRVFDDGILQYNFDYTLADAQVYLEGTVDFGTLTAADTDNQVFRIAVLPVALVSNKSVDINNLNSLMQSFDIDKNSVKTIHLTK